MFKWQGRCFYACSASRDQQCRFFCWVDSAQTSSGDKQSAPIVNLSSTQDIESFFTGHGIPLYCECFFYSRKVPKVQQVRNLSQTVNLFYFRVDIMCLNKLIDGYYCLIPCFIVPFCSLI